MTGDEYSVDVVKLQGHRNRKVCNIVARHCGEGVFKEAVKVCAPGLEQGRISSKATGTGAWYRAGLRDWKRRLQQAI